jgi:hypothetical protein
MLGRVPFTVSHLAAVLPLRGRSGRLSRLPVAPLVVGAMVPDLPAVVGENWLRPRTHGLPAAVTLDVVLTLVVVVIWALGVKPAVVTVAPALAARWDPAPRWRPMTAWWWYVAAALGSLTHVVWDAFTHSGEGAAVWFPELSGHGVLFFALQLGSSALGLAYVLLWSRSWWRRTAARADGARLASGRFHVAVLTLALAGLVGAWRRSVGVHAAGAGWLEPGGAVGELVFGLICGALVGALLLAAAYRAWWVVRRLRGETAASASASAAAASLRPASRPAPDPSTR